MDFNNLQLIVDKPLPGKENMDKDLELVELLKSNPEQKPFFRLYTWQPWCLSLGYHQNTDNIDLDKLKSDGYDLVKRPTGGRAVFHANEVTYSIVTRLNKIDTKESIYKQTHQLIASVFSQLGIETDITKTNPDFKNFYRSDERSVSCFASSARYELTHENKKIVGSAQRVFGDILLQHGSILVDYGYEKIADYLISDSNGREKLKDFTLKTTIPLNELSIEYISNELLIEKFSEQIQSNPTLA